MRTSFSRGGSLALIACVGILTSTASALAEEGSVTEAAQLFFHAQEEEMNGNYIHAAELYELANSIIPAAAALRSALRMRLEAGHRISATSHAAALLLYYPDDEESVSLAQPVISENGHDFVRIEITCSEECQPLLNGQVANARRHTRHAFYEEPGSFRLNASFETGTSEPVERSGAAGDTVRLFIDAPEPPEEPEEGQIVIIQRVGGQEQERNLRRIPMWLTLTMWGLTAAVGGITIWSGLNVLSLHDEYNPNGTDAQDQYDEGTSAELRTNILIGATAALGTAAVLMSIFTRWGRGDDRERDGEQDVTEEEDTEAETTILRRRQRSRRKVAMGVSGGGASFLLDGTF